MSDRLKVLVVDDNMDLCHTIKDIIELRQCEVSLAFDGFQAIELMRASRFDVVLMDIRMPGMDGVETLRQLKDIGVQTPVIMMTAFAVEDLVREALREGAFGTLKKPLDYGTLFRLLETSRPGGALVLVVDDDPSIGDLLQAILSEKGYRVAVARDSEEALQRIRMERFDIALIDMKLPVLNGLEVYKAIRDVRPDMVAVMMTGYPIEMIPLGREAISYNAYACLEKPLDIGALPGLLERIQQQKAAGTLQKPE